LAQSSQQLDANFIALNRAILQLAHGSSLYSTEFLTSTFPRLADAASVAELSSKTLVNPASKAGVAVVDVENHGLTIVRADVAFVVSYG
jgi:hypothetical protein